MGFLINLKGKGPKSGLKAKSGKPQPKRNALGAESDEDEEDKKKEIDSYDANAKEEIPTLVIRPEKLTRSVIRQKNEVPENTSNRKPQENGTASSISHQNETSDGEGSRVIQMNNEDDSEDEPAKYDEVPVEEFGVAMLRGMGWNQKKVTTQAANVDNRKRGLLLGIGAQLIKNKDVSQELLGSNVKFTIPVVKREKRQKRD